MALSETVCAVLVTYNRSELLKLAIESIERQTMSVGCICVVNNASTDDTRSVLDERSNVYALHLDENTGGAGGFHAGIRTATDLGYEYVWIMDDDAVATPTALQALLSAHLQRAGAYGFLCSNVESTDGLSMNVPEIDLSTNSTGYASWPEILKSGLMPVKTSTFVSCFIPTKIVREVGLPVRQMFIWGDDSEYTMRISKKYRSFFVADSVVVHKRVNRSALNIVSEIDKNRIDLYRFLYRNTIYNAKKYCSKKDFIKQVLSVLACMLSICKNSRVNKWKRLSTVAVGLFQGFFFDPKIEFISK